MTTQTLEAHRAIKRCAGAAAKCVPHAGAKHRCAYFRKIGKRLAICTPAIAYLAVISASEPASPARRQLDRRAGNCPKPNEKRRTAMESAGRYRGNEHTKFAWNEARSTLAPKRIGGS
jgi:hypothetical protein